MCAAVRDRVCYRVVGMFICAAVSVMICYRGMREGNGDIR